MQGQLQLPTLSPINKGLIIAMTVVFLLHSVASLVFQLNLSAYLALSLNGLSSGLVTQLVTFPFAETQIFSVIFGGLILWFLGSELEWTLGPRRYIQLIVLSFMSAAVVFLLLSVVGARPSYLAGIGALSSSLCVFYAVLYPERMFSFMLIFPLKAKYFCGLLALMSLYQGIFAGAAAGAGGLCAAMASAYFFACRSSGKSPWAWIPKSSAGKRPRTEKSHLKLLKKDDDDQPKYWH